MRTAELDVGTLIDGRYRVRELLGVGGMSRVYLAHDESLGREVALKVFSTPVGDGSDAHRRRDEVTLLAGLSHPSLVVLFDAALDSDPPYLTMEYVVGETLAQRLHRGALPPQEAESLLIAVADALGFVHERGVVHRDVKPANILLPAAATATGAPAKLTDFGIARLVDSGRMTATGTVLGTAAYISPEQASGGVAGPPSDIYSLGLVLIELLTGAHPFPGTALESAAARLARPPELGAPVLAPYRSLLERMTAVAPADRPTAAEVAADLAGEAHTRAMLPVDATTEDLRAAPPVAPAVMASAVAAPAVAPASATPAVMASPAAPRLPAGTPRRRIAVVSTVVAGLAAIAVIAIIVVTLFATSWSTPPPVAYPEVPGALGIHLGQLQDAAEGTGLEESVLAATVAASEGDYERADDLLQVVVTLSQAETAAFGSDRAVQIDAAIAAARADIAALLHPPDEKPEPKDPGDGPGNSDKKDKDDD